jgi:hypothetical protein
MLLPYNGSALLVAVLRAAVLLVLLTLLILLVPTLLVLLVPVLLALLALFIPILLLLLVLLVLLVRVFLALLTLLVVPVFVHCPSPHPICFGLSAHIGQRGKQDACCLCSIRSSLSGTGWAHKPDAWPHSEHRSAPLPRKMHRDRRSSVERIWVEPSWQERYRSSPKAICWFPPG